MLKNKFLYIVLIYVNTMENQTKGSVVSMCITLVISITRRSCKERKLFTT